MPSVAWLALINVLLALFNLVPAAPLDGGRVLHAVLWKRSGDRAAATISATNAGRAFGYVLVGLGVVLSFALLGWFLLGAARAEATHVLVEDASTDQYALGRELSPEPGFVEEARIRRFCGTDDRKVAFSKPL